jgi:histidine triad (HIT) family protein
VYQFLREVLIMENCLFCKIIAGVIPSTKVYEDDSVLAFRDIAPQAPTHILVIPKAHIGSVAEVTADNAQVVAHIFEVIPTIAQAEGLSGGYRVVSNCGEDAGQTVHHLHFHILGGKKLALEMA